MDHHEAADPTCIRCGYTLRGLADTVCPECGRPFDPADPSTYEQHGKPRSWRRWAQPPTTLHIAIVVIGAAWCVWGASVPGGLSSLGFCLITPVALAVLTGVIWDYTLRVRAVRRARRSKLEARSVLSSRGRWRWVVTPLCLAIATSAVWTHWPLCVRFYVSRPAFEATLSRFETSRQRRDTRARRIGLFHVETVSRPPAGGVFFQTGSVWLDSVGIIYRPNNRPQHSAEMRVAPCWFAKMH